MRRNTAEIVTASRATFPADKKVRAIYKKRSSKQ
jgi:hypothetical protein